MGKNQYPEKTVKDQSYQGWWSYIYNEKKNVFMKKENVFVGQGSFRIMRMSKIIA